MEEGPLPTSTAPDAGSHLSYGTTVAVTTSVLAWTGLVCALLGALLAVTQVMIVLRAIKSPGRFSMVIGLHFLLLPLLGILLAALGARRRAKMWPTIAITVAAVSILTLLLLSSRTWGTPPAGGQSRWHQPMIEWPR